MTVHEFDAPVLAPTAASAVVRLGAARTASIHRTHPLSEEGAQDWLRAQPGGRVKASDAELGRQWDWPRQRVGRRLRAWAKAGLIKRRGDTVTVVAAEGGTSPSTTNGTKRETSTGTSRETGTGTNGAPDNVTSQELTRLNRQTDLHNSVEQDASSADEMPIAPGGIVPVTPAGHGTRLLAAILTVLALVIAAVGIAINGWFAGSLGKTTEAAALFVALGITADVLAFLLPTVASRLFEAGRYAGATIAWMLWAATMAFALLASAGFAGMNVADVTAARAKDALAAETLTVRIQRIQSERTGITEKRSVAALEADLQAT